MFVNYTGGHVFSQYLGKIDISNSLMEQMDYFYEIYNQVYDDRKLCHSVFMRIIKQKTNELQYLFEKTNSSVIKEWIQYMLSELNERIQFIDLLWK